MSTQRQTIAPDNTAGAIDGTVALNEINNRIERLYRYSAIPLTNVAGVNNITGDCRIPLFVNEAGNQFSFEPLNANTGNVTLRVDGLTAKALYDAAGNNLAAGYLSPSRVETVIDMGAHYRLTTGNAAAGSSSTVLRAVFAFRQPKNTHGGSAVATTRTRYPFNTVISNTIPGLSLDTVTNIGRITVPARAFERIEARCSFYNCNAAAIYFRNVSDSIDVNNQAPVSVFDFGAASNVVKASFASAKQFEVQYVVGSNSGSAALGYRVNDPGGEQESFGIIEFTSFG